jgi:hypothetical protein
MSNNEYVPELRSRERPHLPTEGSTQTPPPPAREQAAAGLPQRHVQFYTIIPAATVLLVASSITMKLPVARSSE